MKVKKTQLQFLKDFVSVSENTTPLGNKLKLKIEPNNKVVFVQKGKETTLIYELDCETKEQFEILVDVKMFWDFINTVDENEDLLITPKGFFLGEDKHYTFETHQMEFFDVDQLKNTVAESRTQSSTTMFVFNDFNKLAICSKYVGKDNLETIALMKDKILGTDRIQIVYSSANFNLDKNYFLSKQAINILINHKDLNQIEIFLAENFYFFEVKGILCVFQWKQFAVPDLFEAKPLSRFNQTEKVVLNKKDLMTSLNRMSFFVSNNPSNRVFVTFKNNHLLIENRDFNKSYEKVYYVSGNDKLQESTIIVSCKNILNFLNNVESNEVALFLNPDQNSQSTLRLEDISSNFKFVHVLLKANNV